MKIIVGIRFCAFHRRSGTYHTPLQEMLEILSRVVGSAQESGADAVIVASSGDVAAVRGAVSVPVIDINPNEGAQVGEFKAIRAMIREGERLGCDWGMSVQGDTFLPVRGWARLWCGLGVEHGAQLVTTNGYCGFPTTQVFAGRIPFLSASTPTEAETRGDGCGYESAWCRKLRTLGVGSQWYKPELGPAQTECGTTGWPPADTNLAYMHAHKIEHCKGWEMRDVIGRQR